MYVQPQIQLLHFYQTIHQLYINTKIRNTKKIPIPKNTLKIIKYSKKPKKMTETHQINDIIWLKKSHKIFHPGKIIGRRYLENQVLYRVCLIGGGTCGSMGEMGVEVGNVGVEVREEELVGFWEGVGVVEGEYGGDLGMKNLVRAAMEAYRRNQFDISSSQNQPQQHQSTQPISPQAPFLPQQLPPSPNPNHPTIAIDTENIIEHLTKWNDNELGKIRNMNTNTNTNTNRNKNRNRNRNRKDVVELEAVFGEVLLRRYGLGEVGGLEGRGEGRDKRRMKRKGKVEKGNNDRQNIVNKSARKLYQIMTKKLQYSPTQARNLLLSAFSQLPKQPKQNLRKFYKKLLHSLSQPPPSTQQTNYPSSLTQ